MSENSNQRPTKEEFRRERFLMALEEQLKVNNLSKIKVKDILKSSAYQKNTFYNLYSSIDEGSSALENLFAELIQTKLQVVAQAYLATSTVEEFMELAHQLYSVSLEFYNGNLIHISPFYDVYEKQFVLVLQHLCHLLSITRSEQFLKKRLLFIISIFIVMYLDNKCLTLQEVTDIILIQLLEDSSRIMDLL